MKYREGTHEDLLQLMELAIVSWSPFQTELTEENWASLSKVLNNIETFRNLLDTATCIVCETKNEKIIGMAYLVPNGNPTDIYDASWSYIRFVSVHPNFTGNGIGRELTKKCITLAKHNKEHTIALHTSEMMAAARYLYEQLGFKIFREIDPRLGKRYWLYTLNL